MIWVFRMVAVICFTVLAAVFGHWWVALFSILFMFEGRRKGTWTRIAGTATWACSVCGCEAAIHERTNYCPHCGTKMEDKP